MPYQSAKQRRFVKGVASGSIKNKDFSQEEAKKFEKHSDTLPVKKKRAKRVLAKKAPKRRTPEKKAPRKIKARPTFRSSMGY